ncbi:hypothetical protein PGTUg99_019309 [Puccinia graminis f. sp. tritici]|uniref:Uncharacterized protein n=1 Tax=Puccinia graminis f. sp. tritici TaxID=56615 RepID=A0A5B0SD37_PUCGR|nr:hypothetical protein PGTUg99_019309 [Puccinia graminis f. sp. tritici]
MQKYIPKQTSSLKEGPRNTPRTLRYCLERLDCTRNEWLLDPSRPPKDPGLSLDAPEPTGSLSEKPRQAPSALEHSPERQRSSNHPPRPPEGP